MSTRGVVVTMRIGNGIDGSLHPHDLRKYLLYWDLIDYPFVNGMGPNIDHNPEMKLLREESILSFSSINVPKVTSSNKSPLLMVMNGTSWTADELILTRRNAQIAVARHHNSIKNQLWSIAQSGGDMQLPFNLALKDVIEANLVSCLPVPSESVRVEDILNFKQKRRAELLRFRSALDGLSSRIEKDENKEAAVVRSREEIELSLLDIHKALDESRLQKTISTVKIYLDLKDSSAINILLPLLGGTSASLLGKPAELGALIGLGINATFALCTKKTSKLDALPDNLRDYAYLYEIEQLKGGK